MQRHYAFTDVLAFIMAYYNLTITAAHYPGILNTAADAISHNHLQVLYQVLHSILPQPDPVPPSLWNLLVRDQPDWTSVDWRALLVSKLSEQFMENLYCSAKSVHGLLQVVWKKPYACIGTAAYSVCC